MAAFPANVRGQDADDVSAYGATLQDGEFAYDDGEPLPAATFRVNVVDFLRPQWEQELSIGAVNVIIPDDYRSEQKKLPEYLDMVPGLHVERRGGDGQYSTVTMRGSTSAQVTIYVDGVPQNLGVDGAIDLSLIPVSNVARIEIYRGYVPARFSGAPIGGVINIVTKKPQGFAFNISAGLKSFSGKNADATFTAPLFGGSFLFGFHHDRSDGNFGYEYKAPVMDFGDGAAIEYPGCGIISPCDRTRKSNSYKNTDILLKWQNENWYSKFAWKETSRFYPNETNKPTSLGVESATDIDVDQGQYMHFTRYRYQKADQYDLLLGRRQSWGNLDWGLEANYMKQDKYYDMLDFKWRPDLFSWNYVNRPGLAWNTYGTGRYGINFDGSYKLGERQMFEFRTDYFNEKLEMDGNGVCITDYMLCEPGDGGGYTGGDGPLEYKRNLNHSAGTGRGC